MSATPGVPLPLPLLHVTLYRHLAKTNGYPNGYPLYCGRYAEGSYSSRSRRALGQEHHQVGDGAGRARGASGRGALRTVGF